MPRIIIHKNTINTIKRKKNIIWKLTTLSIRSTTWTIRNYTPPLILIPRHSHIIIRRPNSQKQRVKTNNTLQPRISICQEPPVIALRSSTPVACWRYIDRWFWTKKFHQRIFLQTLPPVYSPGS